MKRYLYKLYRKYLVKSPVIFTMIVIGFFVVFLHASLAIKIPIIDTYNGNYSDSRVIIEEAIEYNIHTVHIYKSRVEKMYNCVVIDKTIIDNDFTVLFLDDNSDGLNLDGPIKIDVEKEYITLLKVLLNPRRRYIQKDIR